PPAGVTTSLDLDAATLNVSYDYGIMASWGWSGGLAGFANLPASVQALYNADAANVQNFTLINGSVVQGQGRGNNSSPLCFEDMTGITVNNVTTSDTGVDTLNLDGTGAGGNVTISNSTFQDNIPNLTNRTADTATVGFYNFGQSATGNLTIENNRVL